MKNLGASFFRNIYFRYAILGILLLLGLYFYILRKNNIAEKLSTVMQTINPTTEEIIDAYQPLSSRDITKAITKAADAQQKWELLSFQKRASIIKKVAMMLRKRKDEYAVMIVQSMGKPITEAKEEIEKCAKLCDYYVEHGNAFLATDTVETAQEVIHQSYEPLGVIFAVMPWNFPFWQVFRFAIPNLIGGNTGLLKHASNVVNIGKAIENIFLEAGCPEGVFQTLVISSSQTIQVIQDERVAGVTLTGSERAGSAVAATAGKSLKPVVLELGGNDPCIIYPDADLDLAIQKCVQSRCSNTGQVCIAAKRIILIGDIRDIFIEKLLAHVKKYYLHGDPMLETTKIGPMARADLRDTIHQQVTQTIAAGATCLVGGHPIPGKGFFYPVTILTNIPNKSPAYQEELFGPIICIFHVADEKEAIALANDTRYGLAATIFTSHMERATAVALTKIRTGTCYINDLVVSDQRLPFGGIKKSGYGRELGKEGIRSFMNRKVVVIKKKVHTN
ncbi:MAG: NAD-dependent succinate-semialdehyde dehydrogenase [Bacteroidota bacterium]